MDNNVYNKIYTKEKWEKVNKYNKELMEDYLIELKSQKKKEGTIKQYKNDLRIMFIYIYDELDNAPIHKLKKKAFRNYLLWLKDRDMSNARINRLMSALRSMLEYASNEEDYEDEIEINYASKVKGLSKESVREIFFLSDDKIETMYNHLVKENKLQKACYLAMLYDTAARRNEIHQIEKTNLLESNFTNKVVGKRGKVFTLMYFDRSKEAIKAWLEQRGEDDIKSLWVVGKGENKRPASYVTLYNWVQDFVELYEELFEEKIQFNAHSFRHSALESLSTGEHYICKKLNKKFDLQDLKLLAHHSDISTTDSYLKNKDDEKLAEAFGFALS